MSVIDTATTLTAIAAGVAALLYLARQARRAFRAIRDGLQLLGVATDIVTRELEHNHGSSIKDDVHGTAVAVGQLQRRVGHLETAFHAHLKGTKP